MDNKRKNIITCALFGVFFAAAFLACVFLPKKTYSDSERSKRFERAELIAQGESVLRIAFKAAHEAPVCHRFD